MGFPEQLKKARLNMDYTQQQVADLMGITKSTYCGYETGKRQPDVAKIKQLACILNTSGDILLETGFGHKPPFKNISNELISDDIKRLTQQKSLSEIHQKVLARLEQMNDEQIKAVLAFINSLDELEKSLQIKNLNRKGVSYDSKT